jgi:hypothetical protein
MGQGLYGTGASGQGYIGASSICERIRPSGKYRSFLCSVLLAARRRSTKVTTDPNSRGVSHIVLCLVGWLGSEAMS